MALRGSNLDVYVTGSDEIRVFYHPLTSQNSASLLGVGSAPAITVRENQPDEGDGRTHTTNTPRQDTHGQSWMSARGACQRTSSPLCIRVLRNRAPTTGWESRSWSGTHSHCSAQFTSLITPNTSTIERPDAHLADGPTQDVAMAKLRPYLCGFTEVPHRHKRFIYK